MPVYPTPDEFKNGYLPAGYVLPEVEPVDLQKPKPPEPSVWGAAFRQNNLLASLFRPARQFEAVENYNPYTDKNEIMGYEHWARAFVDSRSPEETVWIKQQIDDENEDRRILAEAGGKGILASIAAGLIDPVTVASMFIPGAQGSAVARIGSQAAIGAAGTAVSQVALHHQQMTREWGDSAAHVAAGGLLSGVFASAGNLLSPSVKKTATQEVAEALDRMGVNSVVDNAAASLPEGSSVGAMRIHEATLEDLTPVSGGVVGKLAYKVGRHMTPITRLMTSPSKNVRRTALELAENNFTLQGNLKGIETPIAAETRVRGWRREEAAVVVTNRHAYAKYKAHGGDLDFAVFREEVGNAMRNGDAPVSK